MEKSGSFIYAPVCPHLGMKDDPRTSFRYPTLGNYCCHCKPPATPRLEHQSACCFHEAYQDCQVYRRPAGLPLPKQWRAKIHPRPGRFMVRLTSLAVITLLLAFAGWQALRSAAIPPLRTMPAAFTESVPAVSPAITLLPSETPLPAPSKTSVPATTTPSGPTSLAGVPHVLDIPFKVGERGFLIHRVREGENFEVLEVTYVTTSKVILALNHSLTSPLWANKVIVVSPGLQIVDPDLPAFEPYQLTDEEISIDALAKKLRVDAALLRYYNNCPDGCQLEAGNWLIIPHPEP